MSEWSATRKLRSPTESGVRGRVSLHAPGFKLTHYQAAQNGEQRDAHFGHPHFPGKTLAGFGRRGFGRPPTAYSSRFNSRPNTPDDSGMVARTKVQRC